MKNASVKRWSTFHTMLFRLSGGRVGKRLVDNDMLLLTTIGHVTGRPHTVPLLYLRDDRSLIVIASYGGRPQHPTWYQNLVATPKAQVRTSEMTVQCLARTATPVERAVWWPRVVEAYHGYSVYQSRTDRQIPVVFLDPL